MSRPVQSSVYAVTCDATDLDTRAGCKRKAQFVAGTPKLAPLAVHCAKHRRRGECAAPDAELHLYKLVSTRRTHARAATTAAVAREPHRRGRIHVLRAPEFGRLAELPGVLNVLVDLRGWAAQVGREADQLSMSRCGSVPVCSPPGRCALLRNYIVYNTVFEHELDAGALSSTFGARRAEGYAARTPRAAKLSPRTVQAVCELRGSVRAVHFCADAASPARRIPLHEAALHCAALYARSVRAEPQYADLRRLLDVGVDIALHADCPLLDVGDVVLERQTAGAQLAPLFAPARFEARGNGENPLLSNVCWEAVLAATLLFDTDGASDVDPQLPWFHAANLLLRPPEEDARSAEAGN